MLTERAGDFPVLRGALWAGSHCAKLSLGPPGASAPITDANFHSRAGPPEPPPINFQCIPSTQFTQERTRFSNVSGFGPIPFGSGCWSDCWFCCRLPRESANPGYSSPSRIPLHLPPEPTLPPPGLMKKSSPSGPSDSPERVSMTISPRAMWRSATRDLLLKADKIRGNDRTQEVEGEGSVYFEQGLTRLHASRFKFNLDSQTGTFYDVRGKTRVEFQGRSDTGFLFQAKEVRKVGADEYRMVDGTVTACEDPVPKWSFSAKGADFKVGRARQPAARSIQNQETPPCSTSPYLRAPTSERQRKTGFLLPSTGNSSSRGRSVSGSLFFDLGPAVPIC